MIKCFYHGTDLDGQCSAALIKYKYPTAELTAISHGDIFPLKKINQDDLVFMVDYALQPFSEMIALYEKIGANLIWIDHHKSAITEAQNFKSEIKGLQVDGQAACELTWQYLFPKQSLPPVVKLLGRYDVWDHYHSDVVDFQYGFKINDTAPENQTFWQAWFENSDPKTLAETIKNGQLILKYKNQEDAKLCQGAAFETEILGYRALVLNKLFSSSQVFQSVAGWENYDLLVCFGLGKKGDWKVSFYSSKPEVDCAELAKNFGGGGHRGAAGASFANFEALPFKIK